MSFAAAAQAGPPNAAARMCPLGRLINSLDEVEAEGLRAIAHPESGWSHRAVTDRCRAEGHQISKDTVGDHRTGRCRCVVR